MLDKTIYEKNEIASTLNETIKKISDIMSGIEVAEYGINLDKKDHSKLGTLYFFFYIYMFSVIRFCFNFIQKYHRKYSIVWKMMRL